MTTRAEKTQGEIYQQMIRQALSALDDLEHGDTWRVEHLLSLWEHETPVKRLLLRETGRHADKILIPSRRDHPFYQPPHNCQIPDIGQIYEALFGCRTSGWFVEAGGYDGESYSNTSFLADLGWQGIYIEPVPEYAAFCRRRHRVNPQVSVAEVAVGAQEGNLDLHIANVFSSADPEQIDHLRRDEVFSSYLTPATVTVPMQTLDQVLARHGVPPGFDLMVLDLEGYELEALTGCTLDHWRPGVIILETVDRHPDFAGTAMSDRSRLCREVLAADYQEVWGDAVNSIYRRSR